MIFIRLAFLILVFVSLSICAQTQQLTSKQINQEQSYKFDEYKKITNKELRTRLRKFLIKVLRDSATGDIVVYAPNKAKLNLRVDAIAKFIRQSYSGGFLDFDVSKVTFVSVESKEERTEFWIVPKGAKPPQFEK